MENYSDSEDSFDSLDNYCIGETNRNKYTKSIDETKDIINKSGTWIKRLHEELKELHESRIWGITAEACDDDMSLWTVKICGPKDSLYEGGEFEGILKFTSEFPYIPPSFEFISRVFHPNISEEGVVCLDQLYKYWNPCFTVSSFLGSIQCLLADPNPNQPLNLSAAFYFKEHFTAYAEMVRQNIKMTQTMVEEEAVYQLSKLGLANKDGIVMVTDCFKSEIKLN